MWNIFYNLIFPAVFGHAFEGGSFDDGVLGKAKHINLEHSAMVRGAVPKENLLEWSVEEGWGPLCQFLDKPVPSVPFPKANAGEGFAARRDATVKARMGRAAVNMGMCLAMLILAIFLFRSTLL